MEEKLTLTQEWDKTFPKSDKVEHRKVTFHNRYGITLCGKNHFGSFINGNLMRPPEGANLHQWLTRNEMGIYSPLVDLMANADLGGKTVLYMLDAIICAPSEGSSITGENSCWQQPPLTATTQPAYLYPRTRWPSTA